MISRLSEKELDLLDRVDGKEELRPLFFREVKGLKWFCELSKRSYFDPEANPVPELSEDRGYVKISDWSAIDYLVNSAPELSEEGNLEYADKFLQIIVDATEYAKDKQFSNWRTWWQFSQIIVQIPHNAITLDKISVVDYWFNDENDNVFIAQEVGGKWLPILLLQEDAHAQQLAIRTIDILYKIIFIGSGYGEKGRLKAVLRFDHYQAEKFTDELANLSGMKLGSAAPKIFDAHLRVIFDHLNIDQSSWMWQPAIEDHDQNRNRKRAENILIRAYRTALLSYISVNPSAASEYVKGMLSSDYQTIQRLAIYIVGENFHLFADVVDGLLDEKYLTDIFQHEIWHFLNKNYCHFGKRQQEKILQLILDITKDGDEGEDDPRASTYRKAIWFSAVKGFGEIESKYYAENIKAAGAEPEHPDFSYYTTSKVWEGAESPMSVADLKALPIDGLIDYLNNYEDSGKSDEPGKEGLLRVFRELIKTYPYYYCHLLDNFLHLDLAYLCQVVEAYKEKWMEVAPLPWDGIWQKLFEFCLSLSNQERFVLSGNVTHHDSFANDRCRIISGISQLIEEGTNSDRHAFNRNYLKDAEKLICRLLDKLTGIDYKVDSNAILESINTPRGHCLEALFHLALRSCRISDKDNNKDHSKVWEHFRPYFENELELADSANPQYECAILVTMYLPNFMYMSKDWVLTHLGKIFDQNNYIKWLCAMKGYSNVLLVYEDIYKHLKKHGDFLKVLDDEYLKDELLKKVIENVAVAYLYGIENFDEENSLIGRLIERNVHEELSCLIWFIRSSAAKNDHNIRIKIYELWASIQSGINFSSIKGRKLASELCRWAVFVDRIDDERRNLLLSIAPYADESHNSPDLLKTIAEISETQPFEAYKIWAKMLEGSNADYPENAIKKILTNLVKTGADGHNKAKAAVSEYLKHGNEWPRSQLKEIRAAV